MLSLINIDICIKCRYCLVLLNGVVLIFVFIIAFRTLLEYVQNRDKLIKIRMLLSSALCMLMLQWVGPLDF